jgi:EAL and modified HD-GYP domain-containing signal transduction protein
MGFNLFQGYFFSKPEILKGRDISSVQMSLLQVMAEVNKDNFEFNKVEKIISRDVGISYKLLRYMNSAYYRRVCEISSIKQAIVLLGERGMRGFVSLMAMSKLAADKPDELVRSSVIRAKFCELMAQVKGDGLDPSELFTMGLFSLIDAILDDTMENLLSKLPLTDEIKKALLEKDGKLYHYLELTIAYQTADWDKVSKIAKEIRIDESKLPEYFSEAVGWADGLTSIN